MYAVTYGPGPSGQAVDLTASVPDAVSKAHIRVASDAPDSETPGTLNPASVSVALWVRGTASDGDWGMIFERGRPCLDHHGLRLDGTTLTWQFNPGRWCGREHVSTTIDTANWQHVVGTLERSADTTRAWLRLYVNGTLAASRDLQGSFPRWVSQDRPLVVGRNYYDADGQSGELMYYRPYHGHIDDLRIYKGVLNAAEVAALYASY